MKQQNNASELDKKRKKLASIAKNLPEVAGVYLMHDEGSEILYIGKAGSLKNRVGSYFLESVDLGPWKQGMLPQIDSIETIECATEWEALLLESRLIKDHQPKYNSMQLDGRTYPYLAITRRDDFPGVFVTRTPSDPQFKGAKLFGPFTSVGALHQSIHMLQTVYRYRTCALDIQKDNPRNAYFRPCLLHAVGRCSAPCANRISQEAYKDDIDGFVRFLTSKRSIMIRELKDAMNEASKNKEFEKAAAYRDQLQALEKLDERSENSVIWQSEVTVFAKDPTAGIESLQKALGVESELRSIEAFDIAHLQGGETVGAKVAFMDGRPYKEGYRRYKIRTSKNDDYMSMREIISRRFRDAGDGKELYPDLIVIDGGKGQLSAAMDAITQFQIQPELVISIAKKEELLYKVGQQEPITLGKNNEGLQLVQAIRDEAHRFAQHYHHHLRHKKSFGKK
jgi:excinuclease ABC subunit C